MPAAAHTPRRFVDGCLALPFRSLVVSVRDHPDVAVGKAPEGLLSCQEEALLAEMRFLSRRRKWLLGRLAAKTLLADELPAVRGQPASSIRILNEPSGAPYAEVAGNGVLASALSISHRLDFGAAAVAAPGITALGIDLETIEPRPHDLFADYFTDPETDRARAAGALRDLEVARIWSAKEAVLKAAGLGLRVDTRLIEIGPAQPGATRDDDWADLDLTISREVGLRGQARGYWRWAPGAPYLLTAVVVEAGA
jgi:phosphopantetheinyl transferase